MRTRLKTTIIIFYILLCIVGLSNMFSATIFSGFKNIQADNIDTLFNAYILEHGYRAFFDHSYKFSFFSPPFHYPIKDLLFESDSLLGTAPFYWVFRLFFDWSLSFQLWEILLTILTYISFILLQVFLGVNPVVAGLSSYSFSFGLPRIAQLSHPQLFGQFYMCFGLIYLFKFIRDLRRRDFNMFMLFITLQYLAGYYLGWFITLSLYIAIFFYGSFYPEAFVRVVKEMSKGYYYLLSITFWGITNALLWYRYIIKGNIYKVGNLLDHALSYLNSLWGFVTPAKGSLWSYILKFSKGITQENYLFPGIYMYALLFIAMLYVFGPYILTNQKRLNVFLATLKNKYLSKVSKDAQALINTGFFTGTILLSFTFVASKLSLWTFIYIFIPGSEAIRYGARLWIVAYLWIYLSGGIALTHMLKILDKKYKKIWFVAFVTLFVVIEQFVIHPAYINKDNFKQTILKASQAINSAPKCEFTYFRSKEMPQQVEGAINGPLRGSKNIEAMWTTFYTGVPTLNGYTAWLKYKFDKYYSAQDLAYMTKRYGESVCVYNEDGLIEIYKLPNQ